MDYIKSAGDFSAFVAFVGFAWFLARSYMGMARNSQNHAMELMDRTAKALTDEIETSSNSTRESLMSQSMAFVEEIGLQRKEREGEREERRQMCERHNQQMDQIGMALGEILVGLKNQNGGIRD